MIIRIKSQLSGEEKFIFVVDNENVKYLKNGVVKDGAFEMELADEENGYRDKYHAYLDSFGTDNELPKPTGYTPEKYYYDKKFNMVRDSKGIKLWTRDYIENYVILEPGYQNNDKHILIIQDPISNTEKISDIWFEVNFYGIK